MTDDARPPYGPPDENGVVFEDAVVRRGYVIIERQVLLDARLSPAARTLYGVLKHYAWQDASCYPGVARLQEDMGASHPAIKGWMDELVEYGYVERQRRGLGKTNAYVIKKLSSGPQGSTDRIEKQPRNGPKESFEAVRKSASANSTQGNSTQKNKTQRTSKASSAAASDGADAKPSKHGAVIEALEALGITYTFVGRDTKVIKDAKGISPERIAAAYAELLKRSKTVGFYAQNLSVAFAVERINALEQPEVGVTNRPRSNAPLTTPEALEGHKAAARSKMARTMAEWGAPNAVAQ